MNWRRVLLGLSLLAAPAWGAPLTGDELCGLLYGGLSTATFSLPEGMPQDLIKRVDMEGFLTDAHDSAKIMAWQIAGEERGAKNRDLTIRPPARFTLDHHNYMMAMTSKAVNQAMAPMLAAQGFSTEHLAPSKRLVLVIHQWSGKSGNRDLQKATSDFIAAKAKDDPVVLVASPTFPITDPALLQQAKRGGIVFSKNGTLLHKDETGRVFQRDLKIETDELVIIGGFCDDCMQRGAQGAIAMALENPDRTTLTVRLPPKLIYQTGLRTLEEDLGQSANQLPNHLIAIAKKQLPAGWDLALPWNAAKVEIGRTRRVILQERNLSGPPRQVIFDFND